MCYKQVIIKLRAGEVGNTFSIISLPAAGGLRVQSRKDFWGPSRVSWVQIFFCQPQAEILGVLEPRNAIFFKEITI